MKITLENIGRRFNQEWIFKNINYTFEQGQTYAILGENGSGKSTLLQLIAGKLSASEGKIAYSSGGSGIDPDHIYENLALAAPYLDLIEDFTLAEMIRFHFQFKSFLPGTHADQLIQTLGLESTQHKAIRYFSSGMKQRTKLALAVFSDCPMLLLDEPTANLDRQGIHWYQDLIAQYAQNRLLMICSNQEHEYQFCQHQLRVTDYKKF